LETGAAVLGTHDFTENRIVLRRFPKDAGERDCYRYLLEQMQAMPDGAHPTKEGVEKICQKRFHVRVEA
jgi:hypothetical protein